MEFRSVTISNRPLWMTKFLYIKSQLQPLVLIWISGVSTFDLFKITSTLTDTHIRLCVCVRACVCVCVKTSSWMQGKWMKLYTETSIYNYYSSDTNILEYFVDGSLGESPSFLLLRQEYYGWSRSMQWQSRPWLPSLTVEILWNIRSHSFGKR